MGPADRGNRPALLSLGLQTMLQQGEAAGDDGAAFSWMAAQYEHGSNYQPAERDEVRRIKPPGGGCRAS
jgi:hypothetical protein